MKSNSNLKNMLIIALIYLLQYSMAAQMELRASELDLCLTLSTSTAMVVFNPITGLSGSFPTATWETCTGADNQIFDYSTDNQLVADGKCLTALPIVGTIHTNLDSCDTWNNLPGAGTYLFGLDCETTSIPDSQKYNFDVSSNRITSNCPHGLFLGSQGTSSNGYKAFLTGDSQTLSTAIVLSGFLLDGIEHVQIPQKKVEAVPSILEEFLSIADADAISQHGCWCTKINGINPNYMGQAVDEIDQLCKEWSTMRHCNTLTGGSCNQYPVGPINYTIAKQVNTATFSCDTALNAGDDCLRDSCLIDSTYAVEISNFLNITPGWSQMVMSPNDCTKVTFTPGGNTNVGSNLGLTSECTGSAPELAIVKL